jgi:hypothetical protein
MGELVSQTLDHLLRALLAGRSQSQEVIMIKRQSMTWRRPPSKRRHR